MSLDELEAGIDFRDYVKRANFLAQLHKAGCAMLVDFEVLAN